MTVTIFGERVDTGVTWTGSVWSRDDNGQQSASRDALLRGWIEDYVRAGGDSPEDYADEIDSAIGSAE